MFVQCMSSLGQNVVDKTNIALYTNYCNVPCSSVIDVTTRNMQVMVIVLKQFGKTLNMLKQN